MEKTETMEINVSDIVSSDSSINIDTQLDTENSQEATPTYNYTEVNADNEFISEEQNKSSSIVPLCITVVLCLAAGIVLGIFMAKRSAKK